MLSPSPRRLTDIAIQNLKPGPARREIPDPGARGLYLILHTSGKTSFAVRYRYAGLPRKLTLQAGVSLSAARKLAADALHEVAQGRDPSEAKKADKKKNAAAAVNTVEFVCREFMAREGKNLRTRAPREALLERLVYPALGKKLIGDVKRSEINRMLDKIEDTSGKRSADLALQYLRRAMNWHAVRDDEFKSPIVRGMGRYDTIKNARSRVLNDKELKAVWKASEATGYFGALVRFLLLTGARRGEAAGMQWAEIEGGSWSLPALRNKTMIEFVRPLSKAAQAIIAAQPRIGDSPYVFTFNGKNPISFGRCKREFIDKCGVPDWRLHDLRRTCRTLLSRVGVDADIGEMALGHKLRGVRATYDRHTYEPQMRVAFEKLAAQIERIINPPEGDVVPLRRKH
jgi:integrase